MEELFRWLMIAVAAPFIAFIHLYLFRRKLRRRATFFHRNEPIWLAIAVRACVVPCIGGIIVYMIDPQRMAWAHLPMPAALRWGGAPVLLAAELLFVWALIVLGPNFSVSLAVFDDHELVQHGPYRFVRHPIYVSVLAISIGLLLVAANWFLGVSLWAAALLVVGFRVPLEEASLSAHFGPQYAQYASRTGRYWPPLRSAVRGAL